MFKKVMMLSVLICGLTVYWSTLPAFTQEEEEPIPVELDNTTWDVEMVYVNKKGNKESSEDRLIFKNSQFISVEFEDKGYEPSNYSLTVDPDGKTNFGTMQVKGDGKGKETSFWKGTVKKEKKTINGSVHTQFKNNTTKKTFFKGTLAEGDLRMVGEEPPPPPAPEPAAKVEVPTEEQNSDGSVQDLMQSGDTVNANEENK